MMDTLLLLTLLAAAPADTTTLAEAVDPPPYRFTLVEPVVVTARRIIPPSPVFILDREWLETRNPRSMQTAMESVSGLRLIQIGAGETMPSIRGLGPNRVAVLLDGKPLNTAQGGGVDLSGIDPGSLERIEVARGAVGALYGPYALGGAVNLVPRTSGTSATTARLTGGDASLRGRLRTRQQWGPAFVQGGADARRFEETGASESWARSAWAHGNRKLQSGAALKASVSLEADHRAVPGPTPNPTPEAVREDGRAAVSAGVVDAAMPGGTWDTSVSWNRTHREYRDPGAPLGAVSDEHTNTSADWSAALETSPGNLWRGELGWNRLTSSTSGDRMRWQGSLASHRRITRGVTGVVRADWLESMHPEFSARLHGERRLAEGVWLRAGGGTAFRAPTFDDLFWPARAAAAGNPDLRPERAYDLNAGLLLNRPGLQLDLTGYAMEVRDWIQWTPGVDGIWRPHNTSAVHMFGVEASAAVPQRGLRPRANVSYTWSESRDATGDAITGGKNLVGRPQHRVFAESYWSAGPVTFGGGLQHVSPIPLTAANTKWQPSYTLFQAGMNVRVGAHWILELEGRNLSDAQYEDIRGYATQGRRVYLGCTWRSGS